MLRNEDVDGDKRGLLNSIRKRLEFPDLKDMAMEEYMEWEADAVDSGEEVSRYGAVSGDASYGLTRV